MYLTRTFNPTTYSDFKEISQSLQNVLVCYVQRHPTIEYCHGLNYVVSELLKYMAECEAFWTLSSIIETLLPLDHYACMMEALVDQKIFNRLIKKCLPNIWKIFKTFRVNPHLVSIQWFICLFTQGFQPEVTDKIWDYWFLSGSKVFFRVGLALLSMLEKNLLTCNNFGIII